MKKLLLITVFLLNFLGFSQENLDYQKPPQEILELVDIQRAPWVLFNGDRDFMMLAYRNQYKSLQAQSFYALVSIKNLQNQRLFSY